MKCDTFEQFILLEQSDELSPKQAEQLATHLTTCKHCQQYKTDSVLLATIARVPEEDTILSHGTVMRIGQKAQSTMMTQRPEPDTVFAPRVTKPTFSFWQPTLAYAAVFVVLVAGWALLRSRMPTTHGVASATSAVATTPATDEELAWDNGFEAEVEELDQLIIVASQDWDESNDEWYSDDTQDIARELLLLEEST